VLLKPLDNVELQLQYVHLKGHGQQLRFELDAQRIRVRRVVHLVGVRKYRDHSVRVSVHLGLQLLKLLLHRYLAQAGEVRVRKRHRLQGQERSGRSLSSGFHILGV